MVGFDMSEILTVFFCMVSIFFFFYAARQEMEKWIKTRGSGIVRKRDKKEDKEDNRENEKRVYKKGNRREKGWVRE